jgi:ribose transport system substrate-binding protein
MKKLLIIVVLIGIIGYLLVGNYIKKPKRILQSDDNPLRFTLVSSILGHPYWKMIEDGMEAANIEFNVQTEYVGPDTLNLAEHLKLMEAAIAAKVDGIATSAFNPEAFTPLINKAIDAGIPVVLIDTDAPGSKRACYIGTLNKDAGIIAAKALIKATGGNAKIGIITGALDSDNLNLRIEGFKEAIKEYPGMKILKIESTDTDLLKATEKAQYLIQSYPDLNAFFGVSATDIVGAAKIVEEKKLVGKVTLVGFDDMPETLNYVKEGVVYATVVQKPYLMGYLGVKILKEIKEGKKPPKIIDTGVVVVTKENVGSFKNGK